KGMTLHSSPEETESATRAKKANRRPVLSLVIDPVVKAMMTSWRVCAALTLLVTAGLAVYLVKLRPAPLSDDIIAVVDPRELADMAAGAIFVLLYAAVFACWANIAADKFGRNDRKL